MRCLPSHISRAFSVNIMSLISQGIGIYNPSGELIDDNNSIILDLIQMNKLRTRIISKIKSIESLPVEKISLESRNVILAWLKNQIVYLNPLWICPRCSCEVRSVTSSNNVMRIKLLCNSCHYWINEL